MVGGATGAAMTAVTMIFEMTRDYDIVMPMIVSVAISIGIRRLLSREKRYYGGRLKHTDAICRSETDRGE